MSLSTQVRSLFLGSVALLAFLGACGGGAPHKPGTGSGGAGVGSGAGGTTRIGGKTGTGGSADTGGTSGTGAVTGTGGGAGAGGMTNGGGTTTGGSSGGGGIGGKGGSGGGFVPPAGPLVIDVSTATNPVLPGSRVFYTVTIGNVSNRAVEAVGLAMRVPTGLQFAYNPDTYPQSTNCISCVANSIAMWNLGTLSAGTSRIVTINAAVLQTVGNGDSISASFDLSATGINAINVIKTVQVYGPTASSQLSLGTTANPVTAKQPLKFDLDVGNIDPGALTGAELRLTLPPGLTAAAISDSGTQGAPGVIVWTLGTMAVGSALHRTVEVTVDATVTPAAVLAAHAVLVHDGGPAIDASADYAVAVVNAAPPLRVEIGTATNPAVPDARLFYRMTVSNSSPRAVDGVSVLLWVPQGIQYAYSPDTVPQNTGCISCVANSQSTWNLGSIAAGASQTITINAQVVASQVGAGNLIRAPFIVAATGVDFVSLVKTVQVNNRPPVQLTLGTAMSPIAHGQPLTFDIDLGQSGTAPVTGAVLRAEFPTAGVVVGAIADGGMQTVPGQIVWNIGNFAVGTALHRKVDLMVDGAATPGTILPARALLTYDGGAAVDAIADYVVPVVAEAPPLRITVTAAPNPAAPGARLLYTATISNTSAGAVTGIGALMKVPTGLQFAYNPDAQPQSAGCISCVGDSTASWTFASLAVGGNQVITINSSVLATVVDGSLISVPFRLDATGLASPIYVVTTVPAHL